MMARRVKTKGVFSLSGMSGIGMLSFMQYAHITLKIFFPAVFTCYPNFLRSYLLLEDSERSINANSRIQKLHHILPIPTRREIDAL